MNKIIFFDTETTGLDPKVHGIHQLAGEIMIGDKVADKFEYRINPFKGCEVDREALAISNTSSLDFLKYCEEYQIDYMLGRVLKKHIRFFEKNDKFFLAGWRAPEFDVKFLQAFFDRNGGRELYDSYFWSNTIDIKVLATQHLIDKRREMESFSLKYVAEYLGITVNNSRLHSAAYDACLSRKIYKKVKG